MLFRAEQIWGWVVLLAVLAVGCVQQPAQKKEEGQPAGATEALQAAGPFRGDPFQSDATRALAQDLDAPEFSRELMAAAGACNCAPGLTAKMLQRLARSRGVLPEALVPPIRKSIKDNGQLQTLLNLPLFGGVLTDLFASDQKINDEIRKGVVELIENGTPGGSSLADRLDFRFDGFPRLKGQDDRFALADQVGRWQLVLGTNNIWTGGSPLEGGDHGLQTLETMRLLAEWSYLYGLDKREDGGHYGGLATIVDSGSDLSAFDPRENPDQQGLFFGYYDVKIPNSGSVLDLALKGQEKWQHDGKSITLKEQAELWTAAALAFNRLRPENRRAIGSLFSGGELPNESHQLALAFLPGLQWLLQERFIDADARLIRAEVSLSGASSDQPASLEDLVALIRALQLWVNELEDVRDAELSDDLVQQLESAPDALQKAIQLAVQTILKDHIFHAGRNQVVGLAMRANAGDARPADLALAAEAMAVLVAAEQDLLESPLLRTRLQHVAQWFVGQRLAPIWDQQRPADLDAAGLLWSWQALQRLGRYSDSQDWPWMATGQKALEQMVQKLGGRLGDES